MLFAALAAPLPRCYNPPAARACTLPTSRTLVLHLLPSSQLFLPGSALRWFDSTLDCLFWFVDSVRLFYRCRSLCARWTSCLRCRSHTLLPMLPLPAWITAVGSCIPYIATLPEIGRMTFVWNVCRTCVYKLLFRVLTGCLFVGCTLYPTMPPSITPDAGPLPLPPHSPRTLLLALCLYWCAAAPGLRLLLPVTAPTTAVYSDTPPRPSSPVVFSTACHCLPPTCTATLRHRLCPYLSHALHYNIYSIVTWVVRVTVCCVHPQHRCHLPQRSIFTRLRVPTWLLLAFVCVWFLRVHGTFGWVAVVLLPDVRCLLLPRGYPHPSPPPPPPPFPPAPFPFVATTRLHPLHTLHTQRHTTRV